MQREMPGKLWELAQRFRGVASGAEAAKELAGRDGMYGLEQIERMKQRCYEDCADEIETLAKERYSVLRKKDCPCEVCLEEMRFLGVPEDREVKQ